MKPPDFSDIYDKSPEWKGIDKERKKALGLTTSTPVAEIVGEYTGEEDNTFTFQVAQSGKLPGEKDVLIIWNDETGRTGELRNQ